MSRSVFSYEIQRKIEIHIIGVISRAMILKATGLDEASGDSKEMRFEDRPLAHPEYLLRDTACPI